jgi:hypothetical protein
MCLARLCIARCLKINKYNYVLRTLDDDVYVYVYDSLGSNSTTCHNGSAGRIV